MVIAGERILSVGDAPPPEAAAKMERVDASGMTVMPGLIDAHCHISFDEPSSNDELFHHRREGLAAIIAAVNARKLLCAGVTGFLDADSLFEIGVDLRDAIEAGIVPGPRMATGGNALLTAAGGTAGRLIPDEGLIGYGKVVRSADEITAEVRRQIKRGVDWIKVHVTGLTPRQKRAGEAQAWRRNELELVVDVAHSLDTPVVGHCRGADSIKDAAEAGFDLILHATYMDEAALEAVVEAAVPIVPTFTFQANLADYGDQVAAGPEIRAIFQKEIESSCAHAKTRLQGRVPLLCGTESGFSLTPYGDWHYRETGGVRPRSGAFAPAGHSSRHQRGGPRHRPARRDRRRRARAPGRPHPGRWRSGPRRAGAWRPPTHQAGAHRRAGASPAMAGPEPERPTRMAGFHLRQPNSTPQLDQNALTLKSR